ncbi:MAG: Smr/MutS family protein [Pseudomonadota bacterium]
MNRKLTESERKLWQNVVSDAKPLERPAKQQREKLANDPAPAPRSAPSFNAPPRVQQPTPTRGKEPATLVDLADHAPRAVGRPEPGIDRRTADRLRKGERAPDARIDLHGMNSARAHVILDGFIRDALARNLRCVLVITGKGGRHATDDAPFMRSDQGVLRQAVPRWLRAGPHAARIVGIYAAHLRHGGAGAVYVYLKKSR